MALIDKLMSLVSGGSDDTQIGAGTANAPKEVRILRLGDFDHSAIGSDETGRDQSIGDKTEHALEASNA